MSNSNCLVIGPSDLGLHGLICDVVQGKVGNLRQRLGHGVNVVGGLNAVRVDQHTLADGVGRVDEEVGLPQLVLYADHVNLHINVGDFPTLGQRSRHFINADTHTLYYFGSTLLRVHLLDEVAHSGVDKSLGPARGHGELTGEGKVVDAVDVVVELAGR